MSKRPLRRRIMGRVRRMVNNLIGKRNRGAGNGSSSKWWCFLRWLWEGMWDGRCIEPIREGGFEVLCVLERMEGYGLYGNGITVHTTAKRTSICVRLFSLFFMPFDTLVLHAQPSHVFHCQSSHISLSSAHHPLHPTPPVILNMTLFDQPHNLITQPRQTQHGQKRATKQAEIPRIVNSTPPQSPPPLLFIRIRIPLGVNNTPCTPQNSHRGAEERKFETGD